MILDHDGYVFSNFNEKLNENLLNLRKKSILIISQNN